MPNFMLLPDGTYWPNLSVASGTSSTYSNACGDFTATANAAAKTITFSAAVDTVWYAALTSKVFAAARILRRTSAGVVDTIPTTNVSFAANVLTLSDMSANFAAGDEVIVYLSGFEKAGRAQYNAAPTPRTEGVVGPTQASLNGSIITAISDGSANNNVAVETVGADGVSNTANAMVVTARGKVLGPGGTWDRERGGYTTPSATVTGFGNEIPMAGYNAAPTPRTEAQFGPLQADSLGNLNTTLATRIRGEDDSNDLLGVMQKPVVSTTYSWSLYTNLGAANAAFIKASTGNVFSAYCHNNSGAVRYFQLHNKATIPLAGEVPIFTILVPVGAAIFLEGSFLGEDGHNFATGIGFAVSTTEATYTAGAAGDGVVHVKYV